MDNRRIASAEPDELLATVSGYDPVRSLIEAAAATSARVTVTIDINPNDSAWSSTSSSTTTYQRETPAAE